METFFLISQRIFFKCIAAPTRWYFGNQWVFLFRNRISWKWKMYFSLQDGPHMQLPILTFCVKLSQIYIALMILIYCSGFFFWHTDVHQFQHLQLSSEWGSEHFRFQSLSSDCNYIYKCKFSPSYFHYLQSESYYMKWYTRQNKPRKIVCIQQQPTHWTLKHSRTAWLTGMKVSKNGQ